jgi:phosphorylcholine metabolism protein LicD
MEQDLDKEKFFLRTQESDPDCNITYKHLKRNGTIYARPGRGKFNFHRGIFIDIFPLFVGFNNKTLHLIQGRICNFFKTATWAYMGAETEKNFFLRLYYKLLAKIGNKRSYSFYIKFATLCKKKTGKRMFLSAGKRFPFNESFAQDSAFEDMIELEFERHKFFAPREYEKALEFAFGKDYMMYPRVRTPEYFATVDCGNLFSFEKEEK